MRHHIPCMYINFQQIRVSISVKTVLTILLAKYASCVNLQLPIDIWKKLIISEMRHRITYMYVNFQQNCAHNLICKNTQVA